MADTSNNSQSQKFQQQMCDYLSANMKDFRHKGFEKFVSHLFANNLEQLDEEHEVEQLKPTMVSLLNFFEQGGKEEFQVEFLPDQGKSEDGANSSILVSLSEDRPFIVESMILRLAKMGIVPLHRYSSLFEVERDAQGMLNSLRPYLTTGRDVQGRVESLVMFHFPIMIADVQKKAIINELHSTHDDLISAQKTWPMMTGHVAESIAKLESNNKIFTNLIAEEIKFLRWLGNDHFTFMGMAQYSISGSGRKLVARCDEKSRLGLLKNTKYNIFANIGDEMLNSAFANFIRDDVSVRVSKSALGSPLRRDTGLDIILLKNYDDKGQCHSVTVLTGLFAWAVYSESLSSIPLISRRIDQVFEEFGTVFKSYSGRQLIHLAENYPRDQLMHLDTETYLQHIHKLRTIYRRQQFGVLGFYENFSNSLRLTVLIKRANYTMVLREQMMKYLRKRLNAESLVHEVYLPNDTIWRIHMVIHLPIDAQIPDEGELAQIEADLKEMSLSSFDRIRDTLASYNNTPQYVSDVCTRYGSAFSQTFWKKHSTQTAVEDILILEEMRKKGIPQRAALHKEGSQWQVRLYNSSRKKIALSDIMPMLERMGLRILQEEPYILNLVPAEPCGILVFDVESTHLAEEISLEVKQNFSECLDILFQGQAEIDYFLDLILSAGLTCRDITLLRAYAKYMRQLRIPHSLRFIAETLAQYPKVAQKLVQYFYARFAPKTADRGKEEKIVTDLIEAMESVSILDQDMALSMYRCLIGATLRTNYFQKDVDNLYKSVICFKLAPRELDNIPKPVPLREIFVYSPDFEAVHLRFGFVARGGLRWSDRTEDFRTEVLGLVKAQQVKNAVIIPMGSKGGFVLKNAPSDRAAFMEEGVRCYRQFIASLLDVTDSYLKKQKVRKPIDVVCHDDNDPYLVVAADKGTATFSDFANEVSEKADFWLGDAFASGGSIGYDHKKMGITARGGWEAVKRHFREMGHNTQTTPFRVVGVGDMSGDVFGNGMLLSPFIKLVGAFNHLHIFIDPDPDPEKSFKERQRLFEMPRSSWTDYNPKLMSKGAMIYDKNAKSLNLTPEIQAMIGHNKETISPNELIRCLLCMESDLLWFGGIGTYIKHASENNVEVGDKANDAIRVNGNEVGAKVIGEGANLGVTQLGRIEYAQNGGRCNTDAIDNSAGVNCSDAEVNIKILIGEAMNRGTLEANDRVSLLSRMTEEVGELVLINNYQQTLSLSVTEVSAAKLISMHQHVIQHFERIGELDRGLEYLPNDDEIESRRKAGKGLTRPELSVILAYGKNITYQTLLESDFLDETILETYLLEYFPKILQKNFRDEILTHQLRREIIATVVTNVVINRSGIGFVVEMANATGRSVAQICAAYMAVVEIFSLANIWEQVEALDNIVPASAQHRMLQETTFTIHRITEWLLLNHSEKISVQRMVETYHIHHNTLKQSLNKLLSEQALESVNHRRSLFRTENVPERLAFQVGELKALSTICDIVKIASTTRCDVEDVAQCYYAISDRFRLDELRTLANKTQTNDVWTAQAMSATVNDLWNLQSDFTIRVMEAYEGSSEKAPLDDWLESRTEQLIPLDTLSRDFFLHDGVSVAMFTVLQRQLRMIL